MTHEQGKILPGPVLPWAGMGTVPPERYDPTHPDHPNYVTGPPYTADCAHCGHPASEHEAGECWVDLDTGEGSQNPRRQCPCDWYRPMEGTDG